jgi:cysteinyl-tRNA synthetase
MLQFHNTLSGRKEPLVPNTPGEIRMYVCGITPYDVCHLGHARCYVVFDLLRRTLEAHNLKVRFIQNFTDVDDKIIERAQKRKISTTKLVEKNIEDFFNKMDALGIKRADLYPKVTEHIPDIIKLVQTLIERQAAYVVNGDVYYAVRAFPAYGKLSKRKLDDLRAGARVEVNEEKRDPLDFALWKASKPGEPPEVSWDSPWGKGRPGWHIECSVMALKHLGANFDIHGGGRDLIFPHHENEIAQSEAATASVFAKTWIHNGFVTVNEQKMSKSLGNFFSLSDIFAKYHPTVVRYLLLTVHYRSPLDFSDGLLDQSRQALANMKDAISRMTQTLRKQDQEGSPAEQPDPAIMREAEKLLAEFMAALADDLNTPVALGVLHQLLSLAEKQFQTDPVPGANVRAVFATLHQASGILGLDLMPATRDVLIPSHVSQWALEREEARKTKNWAEADRLRASIADAGYVVEDTAQGPRLLPKAGA